MTRSTGLEWSREPADIVNPDAERTVPLAAGIDDPMIGPEAGEPRGDRPHRSRRVHRSCRAFPALAVTVLAVVTITACSSSTKDATSTTTTAAVNTPVSVPAWDPPVVASEEVANAPTPRVVSYGPDPQQTMELFESSGDDMGTIIFIHGGGWSGGSAQANTDSAILSQEQEVRAAERARLNELATSVTKGAFRRISKQLATGWDVVSINYRLATGTESPGVAAGRIIGDVDRAIRYAIADADPLGLDMRKLVLAGASAGGHLTLMEALTANTDTYVDPTLPPDLRAVTVRIDGIIPFVAPTDIATFAQAGGLAPGAEEALLGCTTLPRSQVPDSTPSCSGAQLVDALSPITLTRAAAAEGRRLMPAYFGYGGSDQLVLIATQGTPEVQAWAAAAGVDQTWYDFPPAGTHNLEDAINQEAMADWLDNLASGHWTGPRAESP